MLINAANQFTPVISEVRMFDVSIFDNTSFSGTITLQRKRPGDTNWRDVKTYTAPVEETGQSSGNWQYRIGCKTGQYTSGSINVEISE